MQECFIRKAENALGVLKGKTLGIAGLSFKPETDDIRFAPSINIIKNLQKRKVRLKVYDPRAMENVKKIFKGGVEYCKNVYETAMDSDGLLILTEWKEFTKLDLNKILSLLKQPIIIDGRNIYKKEEMAQLGFKYITIGK